jgi:hypothetical protein
LQKVKKASFEDISLDRPAAAAAAASVVVAIAAKKEVEKVKNPAAVVSSPEESKSKIVLGNNIGTTASAASAATASGSKTASKLLANQVVPNSTAVTSVAPRQRPRGSVNPSSVKTTAVPLPPLPHQPKTGKAEQKQNSVKTRHQQYFSSKRNFISE